MENTTKLARKLADLDLDHARAQALLEIADEWTSVASDHGVKAACARLAGHFCQQASENINSLNEADANQMTAEERQARLTDLLRRYHDISCRVTVLNDDLAHHAQEQTPSGISAALRQKSLLAGVRRAQQQSGKAAEKAEIVAAYVQAAAIMRSQSRQIVNNNPPGHSLDLMAGHNAIVETFDSLVQAWQRDLPVVKSPTVERVDVGNRFTRFLTQIPPGETSFSIATTPGAQAGHSVIWNLVPYISFYHDGKIHHQAVQDPMDRSLPIETLYADLRQIHNRLQNSTTPLERMVSQHVNALLQAINLDIPDLTPQQLSAWLGEAVAQGILAPGDAPNIVDTLCHVEPAMRYRLTPHLAQVPRADPKTADAIIRTAIRKKMPENQRMQLAAFLKGNGLTPVATITACDARQVQGLLCLARSLGINDRTAESLIKNAVDLSAAAIKELKRSW